MANKIRFEIQFVNEQDGYVVVKRLDEGEFALTTRSCLGGYLLHSSLSQPRANTQNGTPRLDLFVMHPIDRHALRDWTSGAVLWLTELDEC